MNKPTLIMRALALVMTGCFAPVVESQPDRPIASGESAGPPRLSCTELKQNSDMQVKTCKSICGGDVSCATATDEQSGKTFCMVGWIRQWKQNRERCENEFPVLYYHNPTFPPTD